MTRSIKAILLMLNKEDSAFLKYAFEEQLPNKYVTYMEGRWVGVNIDPSLLALKIEQTAGLYAEGSFNEG